MTGIDAVTPIAIVKVPGVANDVAVGIGGTGGVEVTAEVGTGEGKAG